MSSCRSCRSAGKNTDRRSTILINVEFDMQIVKTHENTRYSMEQIHVFNFSAGFCRLLPVASLLRSVASSRP